jgi:hypothetical protein
MSSLVKDHEITELFNKLEKLFREIGLQLHFSDNGERNDESFHARMFISFSCKNVYNTLNIIDNIKHNINYRPYCNFQYSYSFRDGKNILHQFSWMYIPNEQTIADKNIRDYKVKAIKNMKEVIEDLIKTKSFNKKSGELSYIWVE